MQSSLPILMAATLFGFSIHANAAVPLAESNIDWSSLEIKLFDLDPLDNVTPSLTWNGQDSNVSINWQGDWAPDWTTPISVSNAIASASADSNSLLASITGPINIGAYEYAGAWRQGEFVLSANTLLLLTVPVNVAFTQAIDGYAGADLSLGGPGAFGSGNQSSYSDIWVNQWSPNSTESAVLTVTFANLTNQDLAGTAYSNAYAYISTPVPEPEAYALMLAGLGLVGWMARRRKV